ncbi:MAG: NAD-dependent epimerase/dehydratase family protein [Alphaproteobacteria bacterium]
MSRITVIGKNSFLARHLAEFYPAWRFLDHKKALSETNWVRASDVVINCAFHPDLRHDAYSPLKDIDFLLAGYVLNSDAHYIMLSSRAVYGNAPEDLYLREDMNPDPINAYGHNKLASEQALAELLPPERLTILRSGNIFGFEYGRSTFFGLMMTSLKDKGVLRFNIAPTAVRDFLSARKWAEYVGAIAKNPQGGIYNLGAGFGITTQEIADLFIKHYGSCEIEYTGDSYEGQFILDMSKTRTAFSLDNYTKSNLEADICLVVKK